MLDNCGSSYGWGSGWCLVSYPSGMATLVRGGGDRWSQEKHLDVPSG